MSEIRPDEFFELIWGRAPEGGWVTLATFPGAGKFRQGAGPTREAWFQWPQQKEDLLATVGQYQDADLYFSPMVYKSRAQYKTDPQTKNRIRTGGRRKDNAIWVGSVYADADTCDPAKFKVEPTITVKTSEGRYHTYWILDEPSGDIQEATKTGRVIAYAHADDGCDLGGWDVTQLLRVPSTTNNKRTPYTVSARASGQVYKVEELQEAYPLGSVEEEKFTPVSEMPKDLPTTVQAMAQVSGIEGITELLRVKGRAPTAGNPGNRSELMWALLCALAENGVDRKTAFVLAWGVEYNKYRIKGLSQARFWDEICKAYDHIGVSPDEGEIEPDQDLDQLAARETVNILTAEERAQVPFTIVDRYMAWAKTRTDANSRYQQAAFMTVLANIFGEYGLTSTKHEAAYLNLWFMVLGGTTQSRKSTVRRMMLRMLAHLTESNDDHIYDLGSEATAEGLHAELLSRGEDGFARSSLYQKDEVQGHKDVQKTKQYMAGFDAMMTELYDGLVPGRLRAGQRSKPCESVFHAYMTGIEADVHRSYTVADFGNGHLARFLFVRADPPSLTRDSTRIEQVDEEDEDFDARLGRDYDLILDEIRKARAWWEHDHGITPGKQVRIYWEDDAWEKLNDIRYNVLLWADGLSLKEIVVPTVQRSLNAMLKMATILAMVDRSQRVALRHLYRAALILEECLGDMMTIIKGCSSTSRDRILDSLEADIAAAGEKGVSGKALYHAYRGKVGNYKQFNEHMIDLRASGTIMWDGNKAKSKLV